MRSAPSSDDSGVAAPEGASHFENFGPRTVFEPETVFDLGGRMFG